jgi:hypothetical protein
MAQIALMALIARVGVTMMILYSRRGEAEAFKLGSTYFALLAVPIVFGIGQSLIDGDTSLAFFWIVFACEPLVWLVGKCIAVIFDRHNRKYPEGHARHWGVF